MPPNQTEAVLIVRVSDPRQEREGLSLDNQEQTLHRYAAEAGLEVVEIFRFQESADLKIRRRFHEMVEYVRSRSSVVAIVGYRVDRLTRNFHDHVLLDELRLQHGKELHFAYDRLVITPQTVGREIQDWDTKVYLAKMYLNRLKEDAVISGAFKVSRGEWPGKAPFGYLNVKVDGRSSIEPDAITSKVVEFCFKSYGDGSQSMEQLRSQIAAEFGVHLSKGKLYHILSNPFYCGQMRFKGKLHPHVYEPLVSEVLFDTVKLVRDSFHKKPAKFAGLPFAYRGMIRCAICGCRITPERKKRKKQEYVYYHCTNYHRRHGPVWIREEELTRQFRELLGSLAIPDDQLEELVLSLRQSHSDKISYATKTRGHLNAEVEKLTRRMETLYEDRLDRVLSKDEYLRRKNECESVIQGLERRLRALNEADSDYYGSSAELLEICSKVGLAFDRASIEERRTMLGLVLQNCELDNEKLRWELKSPFSAVFSHPDRSAWLRLANAFRHKEVPIDIGADLIRSFRELVSPSLS